MSAPGSAAHDTSVIVVGAGPVGLAMAAELARHGVQCRIVDRNPGLVQESRAIAIHARTLEVFARMGILERVLKAGHRIHGANIFAEGHRILHFSFDELASPYPFAIDLSQSDTERILCDHLRGFGIEPEYRMAVTGLNQSELGATVYISGPGSENRVLSAQYVVGCDGAHSTVRHVTGLPFEGGAFDENFVLADLRIEWDRPDDEWYLWFHEDGLFSLFPLPGGMYRVIAETNQAESPATSSTVRKIFEERGPKDARMHAPTWVSSFRITHRKVADYRRDRIFVAGDAAHVQSPAGGQGMNTGIQDACNLAWKMAMVLRGNAPESLLDSYSAEREPVARSVLSMTDKMTSLATLRHPIPQKIRNRLIPILAGFEVLQQRLVERLAEISVNYRQSPIVGQAGRWYAATPVPGDRACGLFELLGGTQHVVLLFTAEHPEREDLRNFMSIDRYMREGYAADVRTYLIARKDVPWPGSKIPDEDGTAHHAYAAAVPCVYLIRPDGYVGFRSLSSDPLPLIEFLNRVYEPPIADPAEV